MRSAAILAGGQATRFGGNPDRLLANVNTPADSAGPETLQGHKL